MPSDRTAWSYTDELTFIKGLGSHTETRRDHRKAALNYIAVLQRRDDWMGLDPDQVMDACLEEAKTHKKVAELSD